MLLVDAGNTRIKWGLAEGLKISGYDSVVHADKPVNEVLTQAWRELARPERVVVANVAGRRMAQGLDAYVHEHFKLSAEYMTPAPTACGVTNGYGNPAQLGTDRWAAIIGAYYRHGGPICVIACGTAITVDTVTRDGEHLGGLIAPGIGVMHRALSDAVAAIPFSPGASVTLYARDTRTAVNSGILYAAAGFIERAVTEIRAQQDGDIELLLTGGDAERLQPQLHERFTLSPHLVLEGLVVLAEQRA